MRMLKSAVTSSVDSRPRSEGTSWSGRTKLGHLPPVRPGAGKRHAPPPARLQQLEGIFDEGSAARLVDRRRPSLSSRTGLGAGRASVTERPAEPRAAQLLKQELVRLLRVADDLMMARSGLLADLVRRAGRRSLRDLWRRAPWGFDVMASMRGSIRQRDLGGRWRLVSSGRLEVEWSSSSPAPRRRLG